MSATTVSNVSRWMYYAALTLALGCMALAPDLMGLFGPRFSQAETALCLLAAAQLVNVAGGPAGVILMMSGRQVTLPAVLALAAVLGLPLMALAAKFFGVTGLAAAKGLWLAGVTLFMNLGVRRHLGIKVHAKGVEPATLSGLAAVALFHLAKPQVGIMGAAALFAVTYLACTIKTLWREVSYLARVSRPEAVN